MRQRFRFCPKCGSSLRCEILDGKDRLVCSGCGFIFYENPVVGVAAVVLDGDNRILLGRRTGTYRGLWCIPCGYVEYGEDVYDAVVREFKEETNLDIEVERVFSVRSNFHDPERHSVGIWFLARIVGGELRPSSELDVVAFFSLDDLPPLAFTTDKAVIDQLKRELPAGPAGGDSQSGASYDEG